MNRDELPALVRTAIERPRTTIAIALVALAVLAAGLPRLGIRVDGRALLPADSPELREDAQVRALFDLPDLLAVVVESRDPHGIFQPRALALVADLTRELERLPGLSAADVTSLATEPSDRVRTGTLEFLPWLEPFPSTQEACRALQRDLETLGIYDGTLLSMDAARSATAILLSVGPERRERDREALCDSVRGLLDRFDGPEDLHLVGAPLAEVALGRHLLADLGRLAPISALVIAGAFFLAFRRLAAVLLALAEIVACLAAGFGLLGWCGVPIYLTLAMAPVVLIAAGVADELHFLHAYRRELARDRTRDASASFAALAALRETWRPTLATAATNTIGFASFALAPLPPVRAFALVVIAGLTVCAAWALLVLPALLALVPAAWLSAPRPARRAASPMSSARIWRTLGQLVWRRRALLAGATASIAALGVLALARLEVRDDWIGGLAPGSALRRSTERVDQLFGGTHLVRVCVRSDERTGPPSLLEPVAMARVGALEEFLASRTADGVGAVLGPHRQLTATSYLLHGRNERERRLPADRARLARLERYHEIQRGARGLGQLFDPTLRCGLVTVFLRGADSASTGRLVDEARAFERAELRPHGLALSFGGDAYLGLGLVRGVVRSELVSLGGSLLGIAACASLFLRSAWGGLVALLPAALASLAGLAALALARIPLGVATSMLSAATVGIGADYAIHLLHGRSRLRARGLGPRAAALGSLMRSGPAIAADGLAVAAAFGVLASSQVPTSARFGVLLALALLAALAGALALVPALAGGRARGG